MWSRSARQRRWRQVGAVLLVGALAAACGGGSDNDNKSGGKVRLTVGLFGDFGYKDLYAQYKQTHPNVEIVERISQFNDHHANLTKHLATNSGADDIDAVEEGFITGYVAQPSKFTNLLDLGAGDLQNQWLPWKWKQSMSADGKVQIGLGTDVGGLAMCYRRDLFQKAGLPTDRDQVSALWPTWDKYFETGKKYAAAKVPGSSFFDGGGNVFNAMLNQQEVGLYEPGTNKIVVDTNPVIKPIWDQVTQAIKDGLSAKLAGFSQPWNTAFSKGTFATVTCPAWMMAYIQDQAKNAAGKWDIAKVPGGGGNWGGSFLTIPKQSKHPKEAFELAKFLTSPQSEAAIFKKIGNLPSEPSLYSQPDIANFKNPFFNNAPVGQIFTTSATELKPQWKGSREGDLRQQVIGGGLTRVEQGKQSPEDSWKQVVEDAKRMQT